MKIETRHIPTHIPAAAARACGVSRQRLHQHMKLAK